MTTKIVKKTRKNLKMGELKFIERMITESFPTGMISLVCDSFDLWSAITKFLPRLKAEIMARDGKLVIRPDSGDPVDIICGTYRGSDYQKLENRDKWTPQEKGVIELLWDIFGGTINEHGFKVLDPHIGAIYGDSINLERQEQIYERLAAKGFAATNIVLGVGSFTYVYQTRDSAGFAAKGSWFEVEESVNIEGYTQSNKTQYNIYKDPITDDGTKKSLKGLLAVHRVTDEDGNEHIIVMQECTPEDEDKGLLQVIYQDGKFYNQTTLEEIRERVLTNI